MAASKVRKFRKKRRARRNGGTLPGRPSTGRPPGVPWRTNGRRNPSGGVGEIAGFVLPAFGGFAATRAGSRIVQTVVTKKWPRAGKHAGVIASLASFAAAWWGAHKIRSLEKHSPAIVAGAGIAALQTIVQTYIPRYGWLVGHPSEDGAGAAAALPGGNASASALPTGDEIDDGWFTYNDAYDAGRYAEETAEQPTRQTRAEATPGVDAMDNLLDELDADGGMGIFSN